MPNWHIKISQKCKKIILSRHIYLGEADRCKPCACVEHRDSSMRVASVEQPKSAGSELLPVGLSDCQIPFCVVFKLLDEASTAAAVSQGDHSQHSISGIATVITAYCRGCVQESLTLYLCKLNPPPLPPLKDCKVTSELFDTSVF